MSSMLRDVKTDGSGRAVNVDALKSEIRVALINNKTNAAPITMRHAWHASGTFNKFDGTGGSDGATIRFPPESTDPDNAGLHIIRDLLEPVKKRHPEISYADLYVLASAAAIEFVGGPKVTVNLGRTDEKDNRKCPMNGRLPDATQGAEHLREVFGRMGMTDQEIVALSGGHTLGRCHSVRSGFDGPWTSKPLQFDNEYFKVLLERDWVEKKWDGPPQFEDAQTGELMMLRTDIALIKDPVFRKYVEKYARDEQAFFDDFAAAYSKLIALGCPPQCQPSAVRPSASERAKASAHFRELAMHGSVGPCRKLLGKCDVHELEATSGRSALHKSAFWGHTDMTDFLVNECKLDVNRQDFEGDTALHDAARFGHEKLVHILVKGGADVGIRNKRGVDAATLALENNYTRIAAYLREQRKGKL